MKKYKEIIKIKKIEDNNLILSIIILVIELLSGWFSGELLNNSDGIIIFLLEYLIKFILIAKIIMNFKKNKIKNNVVAIILIISSFALYFLPINKIRAHVKIMLYEQNYNKVIEKISNNKLPNNIYNLENNNLLSVTSFAIIHNINPYVIGFTINGNSTTPSVELVYIENDNKEILNEMKIIEIDKIKKNWYYLIYN